MHISLKNIEGEEVLAGATMGRRVLEKLIGRLVKESDEPVQILLDFEGVDVATASFLRESVVEFRDVVRRRWIHFYPVIANANDSIVEELTVLVNSRRDVFVLCNLDLDGKAHSSYLIGKLDTKLKETFDLVKHKKHARAAELMAAKKEDGITQSAWNNRLAALCKLGLLMEFNEGRSKRYRPLPILGD